LKLHSSVAFLLLAGAFVSACSVLIPPAPQPSPTILTAEGDYFGIAWTADLGIVFNDGTFLAHGAESRLFASNPDGSSRVQLDQLVDQGPDCWRQEQKAPMALRDRRLGYVQECNGQLPSSVFWSVQAFDSSTGQIEEFLEYDDDMMRTFSWDGDSTIYFSVGSGACGGIGMATDGVVTPLSGWVEHAGNTLALADAFTPGEHPDCTAVGIADNPVLSPDGAMLAFLVLFAGTSSGGLGEGPWDVFVRDLASGETRRISGGYLDPTDLDWSPSGRSLVLAGGNGSDRGLWKIDPSSGNVSRFSTANALRFAWSPDGSQIAVIERLPDGEFPEPRRLILIEADDF
jgi:hypothetical protein